MAPEMLVGVSYAQKNINSASAQNHAIALHLGVFQGIIIFLREALWIKSIKESNDKVY